MNIQAHGDAVQTSAVDDELWQRLMQFADVERVVEIPEFYE